MIGFINVWIGGIIVAVVVGTLIEMVLPDNDNKKYVKIVIGFFILFSIVAPLINVFNEDVDLFSLDTDVLTGEYGQYAENFETIEASTAHIYESDNLMSVYKDNLKSDITARLKNLSYEVQQMSIEVFESEEQYGEIQELQMTVTKLENFSSSDILKVETVDVNNKMQDDGEVELTANDETVIKEFIRVNYGVLTENIYIN